MLKLSKRAVAVGIVALTIAVFGAAVVAFAQQRPVTTGNDGNTGLMLVRMGL